MRLPRIHLWRQPICISQYNHCVPLCERGNCSQKNGRLPILTPMIIDQIYWLSRFHMVRRERSSAIWYFTTYEFGEQQESSNPRGIWTLLAVVEQQGLSNPHGIWTLLDVVEQQVHSNPRGIWNLFAAGEYEHWLTYTQFNGCVPLIWGNCFDVLIGTCELTHRLCESTLSSCDSTLSMR